MFFGRRSDFLKEFTQKNRGVAAITTELDEITVDIPCEGLLGEAKNL